MNLLHRLSEAIVDETARKQGFQQNRVIEVLSALLSAVVSVLITEVYTSNGSLSVGRAILLIAILSVAYFAVHAVLLTISRRIGYILEERNYSEKTLTQAKVAAMSRRLNYDLFKTIEDSHNSLLDYWTQLSQSPMPQHDQSTEQDKTECLTIRRSILNVHLILAFKQYRWAIDLVYDLYNFRSQCLISNEQKNAYNRALTLVEALHQEFSDSGLFITLAEDADLCAEIETYDERLKKVSRIAVD